VPDFDKLINALTDATNAMSEDGTNSISDIQLALSTQKIKHRLVALHLAVTKLQEKFSKKK
jgi:hypothetical protein